MKPIPHEFTDSLSKFILENPASNEKDWLKHLDQGELSSLVDLLQLIVERKIVIGLDEFEWLNKFTDAHLLAFEVNSIGKKRRTRTMRPERQIKLISRILADAQLTLISNKII
jgi:hypothetical protein